MKSLTPSSETKLIEERNINKKRLKWSYFFLSNEFKIRIFDLMINRLSIFLKDCPYFSSRILWSFQMALFNKLIVVLGKKTQKKLIKKMHSKTCKLIVV